MIDVACGLVVDVALLLLRGLRGLRGRHVVLRLLRRRRCDLVPPERGQVKRGQVVLLRGLRLGGVDGLAARAAHMPGRVRVRLGAEAGF